MEVKALDDYIRVKIINNPKAPASDLLEHMPLSDARAVVDARLAIADERERVGLTALREHLHALSKLIGVIVHHAGALKKRYNIQVADAGDHSNWTGHYVYEGIHRGMQGLLVEIEIPATELVAIPKTAEAFAESFAAWLAEYRFDDMVADEYGRAGLDKLLTIRENLLKAIREGAKGLNTARPWEWI